MGSNLRDYSLNIDCHMHNTLYMNLPVTTNKKPVIDTQKMKRKNPGISLKKKKPSTREESKRRKEQQELQKQPYNINNKKATSPYLSIITLNVNGVNAPVKRHRVADWIKKQD